MNASAENAIRCRLQAVQERIDAAARRAGRSPQAVRLVAVGKTFPPEVLRQAVDAGQRRLGENRVQEAEAKAPQLPHDVEWHLVGHLQSNKAARAARLFACIHSLDSVRLARRLSAAAAAAGRRLQVLVQVDLAGEATKFGVPPAAVPELLRTASRLPGLQVAGLMLLPPAADPETVRPQFRRLRTLAEEWARAGLLPDPFDLSMGMSGDYEVAVEEGATLVRVGSAIFGARPSLTS